LYNCNGSGNKCIDIRPSDWCQQAKNLCRYQAIKKYCKKTCGECGNSSVLKAGDDDDCLEDNTAYFRNNVVMGHRNIQNSRYSCQQSCARHPLCNFWTWMKRNGKCFLKTIRGNVSTKRGFVSGSKNCQLPEAKAKAAGDDDDCLEDNKAYFGNNVVMGYKNIQKSRYDCQQSCAIHPQCNFWTWAKGDGRCYLKTVRDNVKTDTSYLSGSKNCPLPEAKARAAGDDDDCLEDNKAYFGNNVVMGYKNIQKSRYECQQSCATHPQCNFWTWTKADGRCYLKTVRDNVKTSTSYISGSKNCPLPEAKARAGSKH